MKLMVWEDRAAAKKSDLFCPDHCLYTTSVRPDLVLVVGTSSRTCCHQVYLGLEAIKRAQKKDVNNADKRLRYQPRTDVPGQFETFHVQ